MVNISMTKACVSSIPVKHDFRSQMTGESYTKSAKSVEKCSNPEEAHISQILTVLQSDKCVTRLSFNFKWLSANKHLAIISD